MEITIAILLNTQFPEANYPITIDPIAIGLKPEIFKENPL